MNRIFLLSKLVLITLLLLFKLTNGEYFNTDDSAFRLLKPEFDDSNIKEFYCTDKHKSDDDSLKTRICIIDLFGWELVSLGNAIVAFISGAGGLDIKGSNTETNSEITRNNWGKYSSPEVLSQLIHHGQTLRGRSQKLLTMGNRYQSASKTISGVINKLKDTELKVVDAAVEDFNIVGLDLIELSKDFTLIASEILIDSEKKVHEFMKIVEHMKRASFMLIKTGNTLRKIADDLWELRGDARNILPMVMDDIANKKLCTIMFVLENNQDGKTHDKLHDFNTRNKSAFVVEAHKLELFKKGPVYAGCKFCNASPIVLKDASKLVSKYVFKKRLFAASLEKCFHRLDEFC